MERRKSAWWMEQLDEQIMEFIREEGWASPRLLQGEKGISASEGRIRERCLCLHYAGFIAPISGEMYDLTSEGILYLKGAINAENYPRPNPATVTEEYGVLDFGRPIRARDW